MNIAKITMEYQPKIPLDMIVTLENQELLKWMKAPWPSPMDTIKQYEWWI